MLYDWLEETALTRVRYTAWGRQVARFVSSDQGAMPRRYPGYPSWPLPKSRLGFFATLADGLQRRFSPPTLGFQLPSKRRLGHLLWQAHGASRSHGFGSVPSAGGLNALELYMVALPGEHGSSGDWLPEGIYHYDRMEHKLCQIQAGAPRPTWQDLVPAMQLRPGGRILWLLVGDTARVAEKYAARGLRFLLLEAGHLMQNLCLMSIAIGGHTVPLGGVLEDEIASQFRLLHTDHVLYCGLFGMAS